MNLTRFSLRRLLPALAMLTLPLAASQCGGSDTPAPAPVAGPVTYSARYSVSGIGTQAYVDRPYVNVELTPCAPVTGQSVSTCPSSANLLTVPQNGTSNVAATVAPITGGDKLSGQTLYLTARFYSAKPNPPGASALVTLELLGANQQVVQTVTLSGADAASAASRYDNGTGTGNYDVIKYAKVVLP